ncbi:MAG: hypothetical protein ACYS0C_02505 [Planctomycetota bacterium]|jgi:hypothetical protein
MGKRSAGLHKQVSAIFNGVPLPKDNGTRQPFNAPAPERPNYQEPAKRDKESLQPAKCDKESLQPIKRDKEPLEPPVAPKPPAPSHLTPTTPKPQQQPVQLPPKTTPAKKADIGAAIKTVKQIPWQQTLEQIKSKLFATKPGVSDSRQKTMVIIVLIFIFTRVLKTPSQLIAQAKSPAMMNAVASSDTIDWQIPQPYPTNLRDPMQFGSATAQAEAGGLTVRGIVYSEDNPSAVIGSQIMHEGDEVLGVTIVKINENSVEFERNNKRWTQKVQR